MPPKTRPRPAVADLASRWYATRARDLPWRQPDTTPWGVLVSEVMLQQTPVARVIDPYRRWLDRWPEPAHLAAEPVGAAIHAWGRLGYPRRALRLHQAATAITQRHAGLVPDDVALLLALPGVGAYTARAVAAFAFDQRHPVVDTNVRRLVARAVSGRPIPARPPPRPTSSWSSRCCPPSRPARPGPASPSWSSAR